MINTRASRTHQLQEHSGHPQRIFLCSCKSQSGVDDIMVNAWYLGNFRNGVVRVRYNLGPLGNASPHLIWPLAAAKCSGVMPIVSWASTRAPSSSKVVATAAFP